MAAEKCLGCGWPPGDCKCPPDYVPQGSEGDCDDCGDSIDGGLCLCQDRRPDLHDRHYSQMNIEPFDVMEQRMEPLDGGPSPQEAMALAIAIKHITRAGRKKGQPWKKDIQKAQNYLHRALTGQWLSTSPEGKES